MTIEQQNAWLLFACQVWLSLIQFSGLVVLWWVGRGARTHFLK